MPYIAKWTDLQPCIGEQQCYIVANYFCFAQYDWFFDDVDVFEFHYAPKENCCLRKNNKYSLILTEDKEFPYFIVCSSDIRSHYDHPDYVKMAMK